MFYKRLFTLNFGIVVIGRNEGERLARCLDAVIPHAKWIVYVDSGSTDESVNMSRAKGISVVCLNMDTPFTAARARNEGFKRLRELAPEVAYIQFVDGDCEIVNGWLKRASEFLDTRIDVAMVSGRLRERFPEKSIYNLLCDIEWDRPVGMVRDCGGIAMVRADAFDSARGYRSDLIAGEEPELCVRMRGSGWRIWSLEDEMALHDAAITSFWQWWKRTLRAGYAYAQGVHLHGAPPEWYGVRESCSAWIWGFGMPVTALSLALWWHFSSLILLTAYPLQIFRLARRGKRSTRENWLRAGFLVLGKFAEVLGQLRFFLFFIFSGRSSLIEYK